MTCNFYLLLLPTRLSVFSQAGQELKRLKSSMRESGLGQLLRMPVSAIRVSSSNKLSHVNAFLGHRREAGSLRFQASLWGRKEKAKTE